MKPVFYRLLHLRKRTFEMEDKIKTNKLHLNAETGILIPETFIPVNTVTEKLTVMITKGTIEGCQLVVKTPKGPKEGIKLPMADTVCSRGSVYFKITADTAAKLEEMNVLSLEPSDKAKAPKQTYEFKLIKKAS
jgi:hypothetical protein|tara:strand:+ start:829 stop:1230 length:402 start_codon:yes stop_codon:yes gene_type:complete